MASTVFSGTKVKALKDKLDLNGSAVIDGAAVSASTVVISDASKTIKSSTVTTTELGYLSGATAALQTQLNTKLPTSGTLNSSGVFFNSSDSAITNNELTFDIAASTLSTPSLIAQNNAVSSAGPSATFYKTRAAGNISGNDELGTLVFKGFVSSSPTVGATIKATKISASNNDSQLVLSTGISNVLTDVLNLYSTVSAGVNVLSKTAIGVIDPATGSNQVLLKAANATNNQTYTLPSAYPTSNGMSLISDTSGTMTWQKSAVASTNDVAPATATVAALGTANIYSLTTNSAIVYASIENSSVSAYQMVRALVVKSGTGYDIANSIAGTANFGGVNLDVTSGGIVQLTGSSVSATIKYRVMVN